MSPVRWSAEELFGDYGSPLSDVETDYGDYSSPVFPAGLPPSAFHSDPIDSLQDEATLPTGDLPVVNPLSAPLNTISTESLLHAPVEELDALIDELCQMSTPIHESFWAGHRAPDLSPSRWTTPDPAEESLPWEPPTPTSAASSRDSEWAAGFRGPNEPLTLSQPFFPEWVRSDTSFVASAQGDDRPTSKLNVLDDVLTLDLQSSSSGRRPSEDHKYSYELGWPQWQIAVPANVENAKLETSPFRNV